LTTFQAHTSEICAIKTFKNWDIVSGDDCEINIFEAGTFKQMQTLGGHRGEVLCLKVLKNGDLISGSFDKTIKIWLIRSNSSECKYTLEGHTDAVRCLRELKNGYIISASYDRTIKIWENNPGPSLDLDESNHWWQNRKKSCLIL
jgi:WD40 repeat protein